MDVAASWCKAREEFRKLTVLLEEERAFRFELMCQLADLRRELHETRDLVHRRDRIVAAIDELRDLQTPVH
jgi:hypothetical protein